MIALDIERSVRVYFLDLDNSNRVDPQRDSKEFISRTNPRPLNRHQIVGIDVRTSSRMPLGILFRPDASLLHSPGFHKQRTVLRSIAFVCSLLNWCPTPSNWLTLQSQCGLYPALFSLCAIISDTSGFHAASSQWHIYRR